MRKMREYDRREAHAGALAYRHRKKTTPTRDTNTMSRERANAPEQTASIASQTHLTSAVSSTTRGFFGSDARFTKTEPQKRHSYPKQKRAQNKIFYITNYPPAPVFQPRVASSGFVCVSPKQNHKKNTTTNTKHAQKQNNISHHKTTRILQFSRSRLQ